MPSPPKNTSGPPGYMSFLLVKPEPLATSTPLSTAVTAADLACTGQETWRAESFLQVRMDFTMCSCLHAYLCLKVISVVWLTTIEFSVLLIDLILLSITFCQKNVDNSFT